MQLVQSAFRYYKTNGMRAFMVRVWKHLFHSIDRSSVNEIDIVVFALEPQKRKGVMIDVGAHYGGAAISFCKAHWDVYLFEPDSLNRERLKENLERYKSIRIDKRAVSNQVLESATLFRSPQSTGISGLSGFHSSHVAADTVAVTTLRQVVEEFGIERIDFLKVDTEGFDKFVLEGIPWESHPPTVIVAEFEDAKTRPLGYTFSDFADYLVSKGYQIIVSEWEPIVAYGGQHRWHDFKEYPCHLNSPSAWGNFIATNDESIFRKLVLGSQQIKSKVM